MKKLLAVLALVFAGIAFADGTVPDCWGQPEVYFEGKYGIQIIEAEADKNAAAQVYREVNRDYLKADGKPLHLKSINEWFVSTTANPPANVRITKAGLQKAAEDQLFPLTKMNGVHISCSPIYQTAVD